MNKLPEENEDVPRNPIDDFRVEPATEDDIMDELANLAGFREHNHEKCGDNLTFGDF